ncbi:MAG: tetratricopeptide repeat protein [Candidatus Poribacteria bacterium]|nr:tetratricopeptide repeat protein [Candidatus Poribacteria bacterium]
MIHQNTLFLQLPLATLIVMLLLCPIFPALTQVAPEFTQRALDVTAYLEMQDKNGNPLGFGNGFFVTPNLIVTNPQVIEGAASGTVKLLGRPTKYTIEGFTAVDEENYLVLLKVNAINIKPLSFGETVNSREIVYITGNHNGVEGTLSDNAISSLSEGENSKWFQLINRIFPGSSGGPVLNDKGKVVGVFFFSIEGKQRINFAIPSDYLKKLIARSGEVTPLTQRKQSVSAVTYFRWGYIRSEMRDLKGAIAYYTQAIRLKPDYISAYNNRGIARDMLKQHAAAISDYDVVIRLKPDYLTAYNNRGIAKAQLGQYENAIKDYDKVIEIDKNFLAAYGNRGRAKEAIGKYVAAMSDYNTVIRFRPDDAIAYYNRGNLQFKLKKYENAISDYDKSILLQPKYINAYYSRGITKIELGRTLEAKHDLQTALKIVEKTDDVELKAQIEKALQQLN